MISDTMIKGHFTLRAAVTNHRSKLEDFDYIYNPVKELGREAMPDKEKSITKLSFKTKIKNKSPKKI
jgi:hypothetical protein